MVFCSNKKPRYGGEAGSGVRADDALAVFWKPFLASPALQVVLINSADVIIVVFRERRVKRAASRVIA
jgi:hypothetical protein